MQIKPAALIIGPDSADLQSVRIQYQDRFFFIINFLSLYPYTIRHSYRPRGI
jgi:hypothetical protein